MDNLKKDDIAEIVQDSVSEVLEKMMFMDIVHIGEAEPDNAPGSFNICGEIKFSGEVNGFLRLCCNKVFAYEATSSMLGEDEEQIKEKKARDTICEVLNMVIGNILYRIDRDRSIAELEIPHIVEVNQDKSDQPPMNFFYEFSSSEDESKDVLMFRLGIDCYET